MGFMIHKKLRESLAAIRQPSYTSSHIAVLESLADHANEKTLKCFPSMELIAEECYLTERHVQKLLKQLERDGVITITRSLRRNDYRLVLPATGQAGLKRSERASEKPASASEAPLTYSLNHEDNLGELKVYSSSSKIPSGQTPDGVRESAGKPASCESSNQEPYPDVLELYGYLFSNIKRESKGPSKKDREILQGALNEYGKPELYACLEAAFRKKKKKDKDGKLVPVRRFYWEMLRGADFPCSAFSRYVGKMMSEFKARAESLARPVEEASHDMYGLVNNHSIAERGESPLDEDDYGSFEIDMDELED